MNGYVETMWAIHGKHGLYTGTWFTRREAIKAHVNGKYIIPPPVALNEKLAWFRCKRNSDKAVKVEITYVA